MKPTSKITSPGIEVKGIGLIPMPLVERNTQEIKTKVFLFKKTFFSRVEDFSQCREPLYQTTKTLANETRNIKRGKLNPRNFPSPMKTSPKLCLELLTSPKDTLAPFLITFPSNFIK